MFAQYLPDRETAQREALDRQTVRNALACLRRSLAATNETDRAAYAERAADLLEKVAK